MIDLFQRANWSEIYYFFAKGNPPLAVLLLALNTVFFIYWIVRRMRGARAMRSETAIIVQALAAWLEPCHHVQGRFRAGDQYRLLHRYILARACRSSFQVPLERSGGIDVCLLAGDAPIAQLFDPDWPPGHGATHKVTLLQHLIVGVEIAEARFAAGGEDRVVSVHGAYLAELAPG